jgi:threonine dehydratase
MQKYCGSGLAVSDEDCLKTMAIAYSRLKIVLEPGGAVALASAIFRKKDIDGSDVIVVASGGNVDERLFRSALEKYGNSF